MNPDTSGSLEDQVRALTTRVWRLEQALQSHGIALPQASPLPTAAAVAGPPPAPAAPPPLAAAPPAIPPPSLASFDRVAARPAVSLESRIGSRWFNRLGILAVLISVAWFLKLAFDNHWIGPLGRVLIGLLAGAALIAWSERFQRKGYAPFAYSLKAIGTGSLYLSLWAAFSLYQLMPAWAAFAAMIVVTAFNGFVSWIQDAELLALYAIAGGLSTPLLVSTGGNHEITLFTYLFLLDLAVLILVVLRPWSRLLFAAFLGTVVFIAGWWGGFYTQDQAVWTALFITLFFLTFASAPRIARIPLLDDQSSAWDKLALVLLPICNAGLGFVAYYALLTPNAHIWLAPWIAVAFAAFYLMLTRLPSRGLLRSNPALLSALHLGAAVVFLTLAIPLKTQGRWLTIGWLVESAALLWVSSRVRLLMLRAFALLCMVLGVAALLLVNPPAALTPVFNQRFATYLAAIAVFAFVAWLALHSRDEQQPNPVLRWANLAAMAVLAVNALILLALGGEIHSYWWSLRGHGNWRLFREYRMYAQFSYSAFFMAFGAALLAIGFWRRSAFLRWQALVLLAVSIAKVFLFDAAALNRGYRILSFFALGALLLAVSYVYQRDWLNLRGQQEDPQ